MDKRLIGIILAAGKGTRLNEGKPSEIPKVLHLLNGKPLIDFCVNSLKNAGVSDIITVIGYKGDLIKKFLGEKVNYAVQEKQLGTGHAVLAAKELVFQKADHVVILYGDNPLFSKETITELVNLCINRDAAVSLVTVDLDNPFGYGRIVKDEEGHVLKIVEEKDADDNEKNIKEINAGCYCFNNQWLWENIDKLTLSAQGEYYLTDLIDIAFKENEKVIALKINNKNEAIGINTPDQLKEANKAVQEMV